MLRRHAGEKLGHTCFEQSSVALSALGCVAASSALTAVVRRKEIAIADRTCFMLRLVELSKPTSTLPLRSENCQRKKNCRGDARQVHAERSTGAQSGTHLGGPSRTARSSHGFQHRRLPLVPEADRSSRELWSSQSQWQRSIRSLSGKIISGALPGPILINRDRFASSTTRTAIRAVVVPAMSRAKS